GQISGVTKAGLFVKLHETGADGFVPASTIGADYYRFDEGAHALTGERTGESYRLGDRVTVKLVEAAPVAGALRFELLSEGKFTARAARGRKSRSAAPPAQPERKARGRTAPRVREKRGRASG
ncbi:MAG TPA: S1 RNA-binding domain-containing protein, partial [Microvirga sp.]|nr:S1 RNA-binding domain-containing protein [Microvirga sp.]